MNPKSVERRHSIAMKLRWHVTAILILAADIILAGWSAWALASSRLGWSPHLEQWMSAAKVLFGFQRPAVPDREPGEQAQFWLQEVKRITSVNHDAHVALGAAWILHAPRPGFIHRYVRKRADLDFPEIPLSWRLELDYESINAAVGGFEAECRSECLAQAETATRQASHLVDAWRARAWMLFHNSFTDWRFEPRHPDWLHVLNSCTEHDPDNALYDYLAALSLWNSSAKYEYDSDNDRWALTVTDQNSFELGTTRFQLGLAKPRLQFGNSEFAAMVKFLEESSLRSLNHFYVAATRGTAGAPSNIVLLQLLRWQNVKEDAATQAGRVDLAVHEVRSILRVSEQVIEPGNMPEAMLEKLVLRKLSLATLKKLSQEHPTLFEPDEPMQIATELASSQLEASIENEANSRIARSDRRIARVNLVAGWTLVQMLLVATGSIAILAAWTAIVVRRRQGDLRIALGGLRHTVVWFSGFAISFVFWGMCPAGIIPATAQTWVIRSSIWIVYFASLIGLFWVIGRVVKVQLPRVLGLAILLAVPIAAGFHFSALTTFGIWAIGRIHPLATIAMLFVSISVCWKSCSFLATFARSPLPSRQRKRILLGMLLVIDLIAVSTASVLPEVISRRFETRLWISPRMWNAVEQLRIAPEELQSATQLSESKWVWATIQWVTYRGVLAGVGIVVGLVTLSCMVRCLTKYPGGWHAVLRTQKLNLVRGLSVEVRKSFTLASLIVALPYLASIPSVARTMDATYQAHLEQLTTPSSRWNQRHALVAEIRSDQSVMARLNAEIAQRNKEIEAYQSLRNP